MTKPQLDTVRVGSCSLRTATWGEGAPHIVLLHDGLGSVAQWRDVPALIAQSAGATVMAFDRPGHGRSGPVPTGPWPVDWLHQQADLLADLLAQLGLTSPLLVGHSDGGSIALIHAAARPGDASGVVALAAHSYVEQVCIDEITEMRARPGPVIAGLGRHHAHPDAIFEAWSGVWVDEAFAQWNIGPMLSAIEVPVLIAQGRDDEYGTDAMAIDTARAVGENASWELVEDVGHLMHHQAPAMVVQLVVSFIEAHR